MGLIINACVYCGRKAEGHYSIERDGAGSHPVVPLCNACGGRRRPTLQAIWGRVAMADDDGTEWGPTPYPCSRGAV